MMQPEHTPLIEFKNVSKRYDNHTAVNELNLTIYQGEFSCWWAVRAAANPPRCA